MATQIEHRSEAVGLTAELLNARRRSRRPHQTTYMAANYLIPSHLLARLYSTVEHGLVVQFFFWLFLCLSLLPLSYHGKAYIKASPRN